MRDEIIDMERNIFTNFETERAGESRIPCVCIGSKLISQSFGAMCTRCTPQQHAQQCFISSTAQTIKSAYSCAINNTYFEISFAGTPQEQPRTVNSTLRSYLL